MGPKILIGYDGSLRAIDALALGRAFARAARGTLVLACHYEVSQAVSARIGPDPATEQRAESARGTLDAAPLEDRERRAVRRRAVGGTSAAEALRGLAEREHAALLVLGSTTRSGLTRVRPGSVAERLMRDAPCALAVAPAGCASRSRDLRTVAVAFDGREESLHALRVAAALARRAGASLRVLRAVESRQAGTDAAPVGPAHNLREDARRGAEDELAGATGRLPDDLRIESIVLVGDPAEELVAATRDDVDLLVAGSRGYGPLRRVLVGSVSGRLMRAASCPVCVIPRGVALALDDARRSESFASR